MSKSQPIGVSTGSQWRLICTLSPLFLWFALALRSENFALSNYRPHRNIMRQRINGADSSCVISDADGEGVMGQAR
jgi:hypothetical protein